MSVAIARKIFSNYTEFPSAVPIGTQVWHVDSFVTVIPWETISQAQGERWPSMYRFPLSWVREVKSRYSLEEYFVYKGADELYAFTRLNDSMRIRK